MCLTLCTTCHHTCLLSSWSSTWTLLWLCERQILWYLCEQGQVWRHTFCTGPWWPLFKMATMAQLSFPRRNDSKKSDSCLPVQVSTSKCDTGSAPVQQHRLSHFTSPLLRSTFLIFCCLLFWCTFARFSLPVSHSFFFDRLYVCLCFTCPSQLTAVTDFWLIPMRQTDTLAPINNCDEGT